MTSVADKILRNNLTTLLPCSHNLSTVHCLESFLLDSLSIWFFCLIASKTTNLVMKSLFEVFLIFIYKYNLKFGQFYSFQRFGFNLDLLVISIFIFLFLFHLTGKGHLKKAKKDWYGKLESNLGQTFAFQNNFLNIAEFLFRKSLIKPLSVAGKLISSL